MRPHVTTFFFVLAAALGAALNAHAQQHQLTIELRDAQTGAPMAARVGVFDQSNTPYAPEDRAQHVYQHHNKKSFFYAEDAVTLLVPSGDITIRAGHGFDYEVTHTTVSVAGDMTVQVQLNRFIDTKALGFYSGDTHVHITHGPLSYNIDAEHLRLMTWAEDLNFVNSMEQEDFFTGEVDPRSDADHVIYFSKEQRNADSAHLTILGLKEWIPDTGCGNIPRACVLQLNSDIYHTVHAQGANCAVIATHPFPNCSLGDLSAWPGGGIWRAMPFDLVGGTVDAMDILCYTHKPPPEGTEHYFQALNAGFKLPPSAGTDAIMGTGYSKPLGGYRVYVDLEDEPLTMENWIKGLVEGRSFVSNYPLITHFDIDGAEPGGSAFHRGEILNGSVKVACTVPFDKVEIVGNTGVIATLTSPTGWVRHLEQSFTINPFGLTWVVARVNSYNSGNWHLWPTSQLFAQSAPVYLSGEIIPPPTDRRKRPDGVHPYSEQCRDTGNFFLDMIEQVDDIFSDEGVFTDSTRVVFDSMLTVATGFFATLCEDPPAPFQLLLPDGPGGVGIVAAARPWFSWQSTYDPDPDDEVDHYRLHIADLESGDVRYTAEVPDTAHQLPRWTLLPGRTYGWWVEAVDEGGLARVSTPEQKIFYFDHRLTGIPDGHARGDWSIAEPQPNPFNPTVEIRYEVGSGGGHHDLAVFDARGRHVRTLFNGTRGAGSYVEKWHGRNDAGEAVATGVYFIRLAPVGEATVTKKVILLK